MKTALCLPLSPVPRPGIELACQFGTLGTGIKEVLSDVCGGRGVPGISSLRVPAREGVPFAFTVAMKEIGDFIEHPLCTERNRWADRDVHSIAIGTYLARVAVTLRSVMSDVH